MKEDVFRMDRVTYIEQGVTELNHLCLQIYSGEIIGLIPVNDTGVTSLFKLMLQNTPIHYGYVYYRGKQVNRWQGSDYSYNRIAVINTQSGLADDLTVADNVFVMRHGFKKRVIRRKVLADQLRPYLEEIGVHLDANEYAREISPYHRLVTEILRAVVAECRLIVLIEPGSVIGEERLSNIHQILRHYASKGFAFLYVSQHYEEAQQICSRAALLVNGQIPKVIETSKVPARLLDCFGVEKYTELVRRLGSSRHFTKANTSALELHGICLDRIHELSIKVAHAECVVVQDMNNRIIRSLTDLLSLERKQDAGTIYVGGHVLDKAHQRDIALIQKLPATSMIFPELSYMDNLCMTMDHRLPSVWVRPKSRSSVRRECEAWLGKDVFDQPVEQLSIKSKCDLVYTRVLLQKPKVAVCVQPFMHADVEQRMHIWKLLERLLARGISVVILAVNLADSLAFADRLIQIKDGKVSVTYEREEFARLPQNTPWHDLWI